MHLDSVRELKIKVKQQIEEIMGELAISYSSFKKHDLFDLPGVGIHSTCKNNDYRLAIHVNDKRQLGIIEEKIKYLSKGEVNITVTGKVYAQTHGARPYFQRPLSIGLSISRRDAANDRGTGTLGCFVKKRHKEEIFILSCNHVLANINNANIGDSIIQPAVEDEGKPETDCIAELYEFIPLIKYDDNQHQLNYNLVDAAIAKVNNINEIENLCPFYHNNLFQNFYRLRNESSNPLFAKIGRSTNLTIGKMNAFEMDNIEVIYRDHHNHDILNMKFNNLIAIEGFTIQGYQNNPFSKTGDSGSIIIDQEGNPCALLVAGTGNGITYANPIETVVQELNIEFLQR
ncbi:hypothetical protein [Nostoc sp. FACHB-190]|uniref:hypothetical protein n=1 Tax=Nostoc sp. FACHB-190 TaxID=2692838 RepID=UPI001683931D|nr:hypothetical protein [Nostoc sp. FACHB-190]MBD2298602.1 hypothetical protein [Nostoc sp. FACHB-190]